MYTECCYCEDIILDQIINLKDIFQCKHCKLHFEAISHSNCYYYYGIDFKTLCNKCAAANKTNKDYNFIIESILGFKF